MKKIFFPLALVAATSLVFSSCEREMEVSNDVNTGENVLHFHVKAHQDPETRTYLQNNGDGTYTPKWKSGDQMGAFLSGTTITNSTAAVDMTLTNGAADGETGVFEGTAVADGSGTFQAFYPASAFEAGFADHTIGLNIGSKSNSYIQNPTVGSPDPACDVLVSKATDYVSDGSVVLIDDLEMARLFSVLKIILKGTYAANEEVSWLKFAVSSGTLTGRAKINLSTPEISGWTVQNKYAWAEYSSSKPVINHATNNTVWLVVNPTTLTSGTTVTVTGETAHVVIEKTFTLSADMEFPAGKMAVLNLTINAADCSLKASEDYTLVTTSGAFAAGSKYVLAFKDGKDGHYEFIKNGTNSSNIESNALTVSAGVISSPSSTYVFTAETGVASGSFKLKNSSDNYICNTSSSTVNTNNPTGSDWIPTFISESSTYKLTASDTERNLSSGGSTSAKAYIDSNFKDQVNDGTAIAQYAGAISVFKYTDGRSALATPTGLSVSADVVSWDSVANAGSYTVTIGANDFVTTSTSYTYTGADGYFDVAVVAHPTLAGVDTYKDSDAAELSKVTFGTPTLATPELANGGVTATTVTVTWTDDPNATAGYHCEIYNGLSKVDEDDVALDVESVTFSGLTKDTEYTVKVNAKAVTGTYPWVASEVASINITPAGVSVSSVTSAGSYNIPDLTVMAVNGRNIIAADATGAILVYASAGHGIVVNDVITVNGSVTSYHEVWEFSGPTITKTGTTTAIYPSPVTYDAAKITSYASSPVTEYATATGVADSGARTVTVATGKILNVYGDLSSVDGKQVIVNGYAFGYNSSKVDFMLVGTPTIDPSVPSLVTDPTSGNTLEWNDDKYGAGNAKTITVTLNGAASGYSVDYNDSASAWTVSDDGAGTITAYPKAANESTTTDKTLTLTITHDDDALLTSTITLKQKKQGSPATKVYTLVISGSDFSTTSYATNNGDHVLTATATDSSTMDVTINSNQIMQSSGIQFQAQAGVLYNKTNLGSITSITTVASGNDVDVKYINTTENPSSDSGSGGYFRIAKSTKKAANLTSITIVFEK